MQYQLKKLSERNFKIYMLTNPFIGQSPHQTLNIATVGKLLLLLLLLKNCILDNSLLASLQAGHPAM